MLESKQQPPPLASLLLLARCKLCCTPVKLCGVVGFLLVGRAWLAAAPTPLPSPAPLAGCYRSCLRRRRCTCGRRWPAAGGDAKTEARAQSWRAHLAGRPQSAQIAHCHSTAHTAHTPGALRPQGSGAPGCPSPPTHSLAPRTATLQNPSLNCPQNKRERGWAGARQARTRPRPRGIRERTPLASCGRGLRRFTLHGEVHGLNPLYFLLKLSMMRLVTMAAAASHMVAAPSLHPGTSREGGSGG